MISPFLEIDFCLAPQRRIFTAPAGLFNKPAFERTSHFFYMKSNSVLEIDSCCIRWCFQRSKIFERSLLASTFRILDPELNFVLSDLALQPGFCCFA